MHFEEPDCGVNRINARLVSDREEGADFQIDNQIFRAADTQLRVSGNGHSLDDLAKHVGELDPEGAPGVITVDHEIRVVVEPIGEHVDQRQFVRFKGPLQIVELEPLPENLAG